MNFCSKSFQKKISMKKIENHQQVIKCVFLKSSLKSSSSTTNKKHIKTIFPYIIIFILLNEPPLFLYIHFHLVIANIFNKHTHTHKIPFNFYFISVKVSPQKIKKNTYNKKKDSLCFCWTEGGREIERERERENSKNRGWWFFHSWYLLSRWHHPQSQHSQHTQIFKIIIYVYTSL